MVGQEGRRVNLHGESKEPINNCPLRMSREKAVMTRQWYFGGCDSYPLTVGFPLFISVTFAHLTGSDPAKARASAYASSPCGFAAGRTTPLMTRCIICHLCHLCHHSGLLFSANYHQFASLQDSSHPTIHYLLSVCWLPFHACDYVRLCRNRRRG